MPKNRFIDCLYDYRPRPLRMQMVLRRAFECTLILPAYMECAARAERRRALAPRACLATLKAVSRSACHRTPHIPHTTNWVVRAFCVLIFRRLTYLTGG